MISEHYELGAKIFAQKCNRHILFNMCKYLYQINKKKPLNEIKSKVPKAEITVKKFWYKFWDESIFFLHENK